MPSHKERASTAIEIAMDSDGHYAHAGHAPKRCDLTVRPPHPGFEVFCSCGHVTWITTERVDTILASGGWKAPEHSARLNPLTATPRREFGVKARP